MITQETLSKSHGNRQTLRVEKDNNYYSTSRSDSRFKAQHFSIKLHNHIHMSDITPKGQKQLLVIVIKSMRKTVLLP